MLVIRFGAKVMNVFEKNVWFCRFFFDGWRVDGDG